LDRTEAVHEAVRGWEGELTEKRGALEEVEAELQAARRQLDWALLREAESRLERVEGGRRRIRELQAAAEADAQFAAIPLDGLPRLKALEHEAEEAAGAAEAWQARAAELKAQLAAFGDLTAMEQHGAKAAAALEAADDARAFWAERERALTADVTRLTETIQRGLPQKPGLAWIWAALAGLALGGGVAYFAPFAGAAVAVVAALGAFLWGRQQAVKYAAAAVRREGLENELGRTTRELEALRTTIDEKQTAALELIGLAMGGLSTEPQAFRSAYAEWQAGRERRALLEGEWAGARRRAEAEGARSDRAAAAAGALLAEAGVTDAAAYAAACARREAREKALAEASALEATLGAVLANESPESLQAEVARLRAQASGEAPQHVRQSAALREEIKALETHHASLSVKVGEIGARIETALRETGDPAELKRELEALLEEKAGYDEELAALDLARATIEGVAGDIHREFAPRLNLALGQATAAVTGGRYGNVQVDEQAAMRVLAADGRTVELSALSGGTADQLYLSLRLALLDLIAAGQEHIPLLLDDPFVQYDDRRAAAAIAYVAELARDRQVVLMTCHRREADLARAAGAPFHLIALTDAAEEL
jgi:DNA repair exonuclease SbcCD ATPase subunit